MFRRHFVKFAVVAAAIMVSTTSFAAKDEKEKQQPLLCCDTYSLNPKFREKSVKLTEIPELYKKWGIPGISWNDIYFESWDKDYLQQLKDATDKAGRKSMCLIMEGNLATTDPAKRAKQIEENSKKLEAAAFLGVPVVRMNLGSTGNEADDQTTGIDNCIAAFKQLLPLAKKLNIKITIENHGGASKTADNVLKIIKGTDPEWIGSCLDCGNWPAEPKELRYTEIAKLAPYAYHLHVKTHKFTPDGEEAAIDYARVFDIMKKVGYKRAVSIESEGFSAADAVTGLEKSRDLINRHWKGIDK